MSWVQVWFSGLGGGIAICALNYLVGPWSKARKRRERFFDLAFGHDGTDGLPQAADIFTRVGNVEKILSNAALLNGKGERLVDDVRHIQRGMNAIRAELDTYAKVVSRDTAELWSALGQAGLGRRDSD